MNIKNDFCRYSKKCGGCQLTNLSYPEQLRFKQVKCIRELGKFGHVDEIIGMDEPFHYRNKVQAAFATLNGKIISGVFQSSSHRIVNVDSCRIEDEKADEIIVTIRKMLPNFKLSSFNEDSGRGFLRHVLVKRGFSTNEIMVVLVTPTSLFPKKNAFINELLRRHPEITTIVQSVNGGKTSLVLGKEEIVLYGNGYIEDILCGKRFRISARSFYQINPFQTEILYNTAIEFAGLKKTDVVIDAYCGIGTIGLIAAADCANVLGVELNADAVIDAKINAKLNKTGNIRFICADAGKLMVNMSETGEKADVVFMDPPRAGSDMPFLKSLVTLAPEKIVYISCNVETQKRDLNYLVRNGYRVKKIQPVDMFPWTNHVESVVKLIRQ